MFIIKYVFILFCFSQSISPGVVNTGILNDIFPEPDRKEFFNQNPHLQPEDISQAIMYCLSTPEHVQVRNFEFY